MFHRFLRRRNCNYSTITNTATTTRNRSTWFINSVVVVEMIDRSTRSSCRNNNNKSSSRSSCSSIKIQSLQQQSLLHQGTFIYNVDSNRYRNVSLVAPQAVGFIDNCSNSISYQGQQTNQQRQQKIVNRFIQSDNPFVALHHRHHDGGHRTGCHPHWQQQQQWDYNMRRSYYYISIRFVQTTATSTTATKENSSQQQPGTTTVVKLTTNSNPNVNATTVRVDKDNNNNNNDGNNSTLLSRTVDNQHQEQHPPSDTETTDEKEQQQPKFTVVVQHWLQQLRALPNIITVSRILLIPVISYWILTQQVMYAVMGCTYAAISDVLDGHIARKYPETMQTPLGTYLDPLADKLFINALSISLWMNGTLPTPLVGLWFVRDVVLMIATHHYVAQNTIPGMTVMDPVTVPIQVIPTTISKINTGLQFITLIVGIVAMSPIELSTIGTLSTLEASYSTTAADIGGGGDNATGGSINWYDLERFVVQRIYITDHILPALCWITGTTTIGSSLSYYGHSAFIATNGATAAINHFGKESSTPSTQKSTISTEQHHQQLKK